VFCTADPPLEEKKPLASESLIIFPPVKASRNDNPSEKRFSARNVNAW
jgi:hypothetical protein